MENPVAHTAAMGDAHAIAARRARPPTEGTDMFVVSGEALMDVFGGADSAHGLLLDARIGGSPLNVAIGLARLAQPVAFFGAVSTGFLGQRLMRALRDEGVAIEAVARLDAPTTLGLVGLDEQGVPSYGFYGHGCADRLLPLQALASVPATARAFHFGSYAMVVEPVAATQRALVEREHRRSLIAYDPNIRLNVEPDIQRWRDALQWMLPRTHLLKVSDEDLGLLYPGRAPAELAQQWLAQGVGCVVVTQGGKGARAWRAGEQLQVGPVAVTVVDTVGAGDTFQAALLTALAERDAVSPQALRDIATGPLQQVLEFAARAAALTCSRRGANLPRRHEL
jgi:fructokinase